MLCSASGMLTHPTATASSAGLCVEHHRHPRVLQAFHHLGSVATHVASNKCGVATSGRVVSNTGTCDSQIISLFCSSQIRTSKIIIASSPPKVLHKPSLPAAMPTPVIAVDGEWYDLGDFYHKHPGGARSASSLDFSPPSLCGSPPVRAHTQAFLWSKGTI